MKHKPNEQRFLTRENSIPDADTLTNSPVMQYTSHLIKYSQTKAQ